MKIGQIANKKVISTFVASMMFLLVLYVSLSQVNIKKLSSLSASVNDAVRVEGTILDTNENISKENGLTKLNMLLLEDMII